jgi:signal transduction histidine kinase
MRGRLLFITLIGASFACHQESDAQTIAADQNAGINHNNQFQALMSVDNFLPLLPESFADPATKLSRGLLLGRDLVHQGRNDEAITLYRTLLHYAPGGSGKAAIYSQLANLYNDNGHYEEALEMHYRGLSETTDTKMHARLLINISALYTDLKDYDKAMVHLDKVINLVKGPDQLYWTTLAHANKGNIYNAQGMYSEAIQAFRASYNLAEKMRADKAQPEKRAAELPDISAVVLNNIADSYLKLGQTDSAQYYIQLIIPDFDLLSSYSRAFISMTLGEIFGRKGNNKLALYYLNQGLHIAERAPYRSMVREALRSLSDLNAKAGNYQEAWKYQQRYTKVNDSINSIENIHRLNALERQFENSIRDRKLMENQLLINQQASKLKERNWLAGILALAIVSLVLIYIISRKSYRNRQKLLKEQLNNATKDRKIMQIEASMRGEEKERGRIASDLHDGVVSELLAMKLNLEALQAQNRELAQSIEYRNILYQAEETTQKLRTVAHNLMPANLQEYGLLRTVEAFINRVNNQQVHITFQHFGNVPPLNELTAKLILMATLELIQNILKHAKATEALVQFVFLDESMTVTVEDNGVGMPTGYRDGSGMGLSNIRNNFGIIQGTLDIQSSEYTGTTMLIEISLNELTLQPDVVSDPLVAEQETKP